MWKALGELGAYPAWRKVKIDDAKVGIEEGHNAGAWTVGLAASGNGVGLGLDVWQVLSESERAKRIEASGRILSDAGADYVIPIVSDLKDVLIDIDRHIARGDRLRL
jgi:phosphonoacetaldehyde hydrolase